MATDGEDARGIWDDVGEERMEDNDVVGDEWLEPARLTPRLFPLLACLS